MVYWTWHKFSLVCWFFVNSIIPNGIDLCLFYWLKYWIFKVRHTLLVWEVLVNNPNNRYVKNYYTDDGKVKTMTKKEAMEYYAQKNFKDFEYEYQEQNKSKGCGGTK